MAQSLLRFNVDPGNVLARKFTLLEQKLLPEVARQAALQTGIAMRARWSQVAGQVFDRPTNFTVKSPRYKLVPGKYAVDVYINDKAKSGTPPSEYLKPEVAGGSRPHKSTETQLQRMGLLPAGGFIVPGLGIQLNAYGNIPGRQLKAILTQLRNKEAPELATRRRKREGRSGKGGDYFALRTRRGRLHAGVYQRIPGPARKLRSILMFVNKVHYKKRFDIFEIAQKIYTRQFPFHFQREMEKALQNAAFKGLK